MTRTELKAKKQKKFELDKIERIAMASLLIGGTEELQDYLYGLEIICVLTEDEAEQIYYSVCEKYDLRYSNMTHKEIGKIRLEDL